MSGFNDKLKAGPSSGGVMISQIVLPEGFGEEPIQFCDKGKGILEYDVDCTIIGGD